MTPVYLSSDGCVQRDITPCHKHQIISRWFPEHDNELVALKSPPQTSYSNRAPLRGGGSGDPYHRCEAEKPAATV